MFARLCFQRFTDFYCWFLFFFLLGAFSSTMCVTGIFFFLTELSVNSELIFYLVQIARAQPSFQIFCSVNLLSFSMQFFWRGFFLRICRLVPPKRSRAYSIHQKLCTLRYRIYTLILMVPSWYVQNSNFGVGLDWMCSGLCKMHDFCDSSFSFLRANEINFSACYKRDGNCEIWISTRDHSFLFPLLYCYRDFFLPIYVWNTVPLLLCWYFVKIWIGY